jgi:putative transposase
MARLSRITVPDLPHHVTQRGNRRQPLFLGDDDYALYRDLMAERLRANGVTCLAWCLMPNHVHLILAPATPEGLSRAIGEAHRRYTAFFNARARMTGHLFQGRFGSVAMDEPHLLAAVRYLAFNPVRAGLARRVEDWPWSSARAHLAGRDDGLVTVRPVLDLAPDPRDLFAMSLTELAELPDLETKGATGRPLGSERFIDEVERRIGRRVRPRKRGPRAAAGGTER